MLMIFPRLCFIIILEANLMQLNVPFKLVLITASKSSSFIAIHKPSLVIPALFTKISMEPNLSFTSLVNSLHLLKSEMSHCMAVALPPAFSISFTTVSAFSLEPA